MKWVRVSIPARSSVLDALSYHLRQLGATGTHEEIGLISAYFPVKDENDWAEVQDALLSQLEPRLAAIEAAFGPDSVGTPEFALVEPDDWAESWKSSYRSLQVGRRLCIVPLWRRDDYVVPPGFIPLWLEPGLAFGTGEHASTRLALVLMEMALERELSAAQSSGRPVQVIDLGTGSGVLALAAARLGATKVWACDLDEVAVQVATDNARINAVEDRVQVEVADLFWLEESKNVPEQADLLVANILFSVLKDAATIIIERVRPGGWLVLSGLITEQRDRLAAVYEQLGCLPVVSIAISGWSAILLQRHNLKDW